MNHPKTWAERILYRALWNACYEKCGRDSGSTQLMFWAEYQKAEKSLTRTAPFDCGYRLHALTMNDYPISAEDL